MALKPVLPALPKVSLDTGVQPATPPTSTTPPEQPPTTPPTQPKPAEYYPGYQQQSKTFQTLALKAQERMTEAANRWQQFAGGPYRSNAFLAVALGPQGLANFNAQSAEAKAELDAATQEYSRMSWRFEVINALPYMLADSQTPTKTIDDVYKAMPNEYLVAGDKDWLQSAFDQLSYLVPKELPEQFQGDKTKARAELLNAILTEPKKTLKAVHNLTVDELMKSLQPISAELPTGMTAEDVRTLMTDLQFDQPTQDEVNSIHDAATQLMKDWQEQAGYVNLVRAGIVDAKAPDLTPWEFTKLLFVQPAMATMQVLDKYYNMLVRPALTAAILAFPRIDQDSSAADLEKIYNSYRDKGTGAWEAYKLAYNDWDVNWAYKMFAETMFDPTTYIGFGVATKVGTTADRVVLRLVGKGLEALTLDAKLASGVVRTGPYLGKFLGAFEKGWTEMWDSPFRGARYLINRFPKTPTQKAISYARQAFMDSRAFLRRYTGKDLEGLTVPEIRDAFEFAVKQAAERPMETGDLSVRVGRYLTDYDFIEEATTKDWLKVVGGEGSQITQQMVHDVNYQFDSFYRKTITSKEAAANILTAAGIDASDKNVGKMATLLDREGSKISSAAIDGIKGDNAREVLTGILQTVEDTQVRKYMSPVYDFALKSGRATAWTGKMIDAITHSSIMTKIDRSIVAPMANQYLLFTNYGPFNIFENTMRSFLGGGELLYPRASSPVDELVRAGEGLTNLPYEFITAQREMGRLEIAVVDPKTNKTMVFSKGKIPGVTKDLPFTDRLKITIGGKDYPLRSWQDWNNIFGDVGTKQRAYYLLTKYKQFLAEMAPDQIQQIADVFTKNQDILDSIKSISKGDKQDLVRALEQDATVGADMVRKHDIPLPELERRKALREINKTLDKATDIYGPQKQLIRDRMLDGSMWKDIDGSIAAIKDSVREFNIVSLQNEGQALDKLVADLKDFAPANNEELLRNLSFISDIVDGISERIGEVRSITQSRAAQLTGTEIDDFHRAASETLGNFLGKSKESVDSMLDSITKNLSRPRTLLDELTLNIKLGESKLEGLPAVGFHKAPIILDGEDVGSVLWRPWTKDELLADVLEVTKSGILDRGMMKDIDILLSNLAQEQGFSKVSVASKAQHKLLYTGGGYTQKMPGYFVKDVMKAKPGIQLTAEQTTRLSALTDSIKLRHANAVATRDLDRKIINDAVSNTPRNKRNKEWWEWLQQKRSKEAWEPYWTKEEQLFNNVEDLKLGMMTSLGVDTMATPTMPAVVDKLTPAHVAYLMGVAGDDMYKALTKVGAMTTIRSKNRFTTWVYRRANKAASQFGKTAEEIGFDRTAIGDVYDQMFQNVGIDPHFANKEVLAPAMMQLDDVKNELVHQYGLKAIPENDYVKFKSYINQVADGIQGIDLNEVTGKTMKERRNPTNFTVTETSEEVEMISPEAASIFGGKPFKEVSYKAPGTLISFLVGDDFIVFTDISRQVGDTFSTGKIKGSAGSIYDGLVKLSKDYRGKPILTTAMTDDSWNMVSRLEDRGLISTKPVTGTKSDILNAYEEPYTHKSVEINIVSPEKGYDNSWTAIREEAMSKARTQYEMDFTDYDNKNMVDAAMRTVYPFWTYEWQRWFWLPRAMLKTPGVGTGVGRFLDYSDNGYVAIPGTDIQFNPLRGTVFMGGFRRLYQKDYPEYYDAFPGMNIIDFIARMGFYPGVQIMLPIVAVGAATGKPEWSELIPSWARTALDAARAVAPNTAGKVIDHLFPDRFKDYLTMLTLGEMGYDSDAIWRKKKAGGKLTPEEQKLWLSAENQATGLKGMLFEQTGVFRLRPQEYQQFQDDQQKMIEEMTGVSVDVQKQIQNNYSITGKRFSDYYKLDALQQKVLYSTEAFKRWQGVTTPLQPSSWQQEDIDIRDYYENVQELYADYRKNGVFDEQGGVVSPSLNELTQQWIDGKISPDQWRSGRGDLLSNAATAVMEMGKRVYPDVPKTLDERAARYAERGTVSPTFSADQELMYMYYDIKPELVYNWDTGVNEYDYDTYYAKIDALLSTLQGDFKQEFLARIQYDWNGMEKLYWNISRDYLRPYRMARDLVLEQYTPEQQADIKRYEVARGDEREALKELLDSHGQKLMSGFSEKVSEVRKHLRYLDPDMDAWAYFFGITDTFITKAAEAKYKELVKQYMIPTMAK